MTWWLRSVFYGVYVTLMMRFLLKLFEPGTADTWMVFERLDTVLPLVDTLLTPVLLPINLMVAGIHPFLPQTLTTWFPSMDAAVFFETAVSFLLLIPGFEATDAGRVLISEPYANNVPGTMEWVYPMALVFWVAVENMSEGVRDMAKQAVHGLRHRLIMQRIAWRHRQDMARIQDLQKQAHEKSQTSRPRPQTGQVREVIDAMADEIYTLKKRVDQDPLTKLYNKGYFIRALRYHLSKAFDTDGFFGLMLMDIDDFKKLNDTYGHPLGDHVLIHVAKTIQSCIPVEGHQAIPCRYGGEELGIILTAMTAKQAERLAETLRTKIHQLRFSAHPDLNVSVSIGLLTFSFSSSRPSNKLSDDIVIQKTDALLYQAKHAGKNRVVSEHV